MRRMSKPSAPSDQSDKFDPDDVLKGWRAPAERSSPAPDLDDLFGAVAQNARAHEVQRVDTPRIELPQVEIVDAVDLSDLDDIGLNAAATARAQALETIERIDDIEFTELTAVVERYAHPQVLQAWQPGAWVGAVKQVCEAVTSIVQSDAGPVVETYPPQFVFALWAPQELNSPLLGRWPLRVGLTAADADHAADGLVALMPPQGKLWFSAANAKANPKAKAKSSGRALSDGAFDVAIEVDWALIGQLVLHHDAALQDHLLAALREFIDAEQAATFARLNDGFGQPAPGAAITQRSDG